LANIADSRFKEITRVATLSALRAHPINHPQSVVALLAHPFGPANSTPGRTLGTVSIWQFVVAIVIAPNAFAFERLAPIAFLSARGTVTSIVDIVTPETPSTVTELVGFYTVGH